MGLHGGLEQGAESGVQPTNSDSQPVSCGGLCSTLGRGQGVRIRHSICPQQAPHLGLNMGEWVPPNLTLDTSLLTISFSFPLPLSLQSYHLSCSGSCYILPPAPLPSPVLLGSSPPPPTLALSSPSHLVAWERGHRPNEGEGRAGKRLHRTELRCSPAPGGGALPPVTIDPSPVLSLGGATQFQSQD